VSKIRYIARARGRPEGGVTCASGGEILARVDTGQEAGITEGGSELTGDNGGKRPKGEKKGKSEKGERRVDRKTSLDKI